MENQRRRFLAATTGLGLSTLLPTAALAYGDDKAKEEKKDQPEDEVSAPEDLMREHGVLNRILLIFEEGMRRLRSKEDVSPDAATRDKARVADEAISNWETELSQREDLYKAVKVYAETNANLAGERGRLLRFMLRDYHRSGMDLPADKRALLLWGTGSYRADTISLACLPLPDGLPDLRQIRYFTGASRGVPRWSEAGKNQGSSGNRIGPRGVVMDDEPSRPDESEFLTVKQAARHMNVSPSLKIG